MRKLLLVLIAAAALLVLWSLGSGAQIIDGDACSNACYEQKSECITSCGEHTNPMECESQCSEALRDCLDRC